MPDTLRAFRRVITEGAIRGAIGTTASLPIGLQRSVLTKAVRLAGRVPSLRRAVRDNIRLAFGEEPLPGIEDRYFIHVGWFVSSALAVFHRTLRETPVINEVLMDDTVKVLDDAMAEGRGVIITSPHWSGHEMCAGVVAQRHPMVMLVREASSQERSERKERWYRALGAETVIRPRQTSNLKEAAAYLRVLKQKKILAITPDLLTDTENAVEVTIFGRPARLNGGAFALALASGAPTVRLSGTWLTDTKALVRFERAPPPPDLPKREDAIRAAAEEWCRWFEMRLHDHPDNWLFWLDKRWSRFLRSVPRTQG